jgi:hypothetical protein
VKKGKRGKQKKRKAPLTAAGKALVRAAKVARKTARMHGTLLYFEKNGKIVAERP